MILKKVPMFKDLSLDIILFESKYPILFTCKNGNEIYLFLCCLVNSKIVKWIGTKTTYETLIELLQNKLTIRDAFFSVTDEKIIINYNGQNVESQIVDKTMIPPELLPTFGEYMDAEEDEFAEEIAEFESRNNNFEFKIEPRVSKFYFITYSSKAVNLSENLFGLDGRFENGNIIGLKKIANRSIAYA